MDAKLKSSKADDGLESVLDSVLIIFRYINGKDVFEAFYKKDLAKRLIFGRTNSFDLEKYMIAKLKSECGTAFTSKLEGMFRDIDLSKELGSQFKASSAHTQAPCFSSIDMSVQVLTTGFWPAYPPYQLAIPKLMEDCQVYILPCSLVISNYFLYI